MAEKLSVFRLFERMSEFNEITWLVCHFNPKNIFANGKVNGIYFSYCSGVLNLNYELQITIKAINYPF